MSSLSRHKIVHVEGNSLHLRIEKIHPDAPPLKWIVDRSEGELKVIALFRLLSLLEQHELQLESLYRFLFEKLKARLEEESYDIHPLSKYTNISEHGADALGKIEGDLVLSCQILDSDFNANWEEGRISFVPSEETQGLPYVILALAFPIEVDEDLLGLSEYSALGIRCRDL